MMTAILDSEVSGSDCRAQIPSKPLDWENTGLSLSQIKMFICLRVVCILPVK